MILKINPADIGSYYWLKDNVKLNAERWLSNWSVLVYSWLEINIELYINSNSVEWPTNTKLNCTFHRDPRWNLGTEINIDFFFSRRSETSYFVVYIHMHFFFFFAEYFLWEYPLKYARIIRIKPRLSEKKVFYNFDDLPIFTNNEIYGTSTVHFRIFSHSFCPSLCRCIYPNNAS